MADLSNSLRLDYIDQGLLDTWAAATGFNLSEGFHSPRYERDSIAAAIKAYRRAEDQEAYLHDRDRWEQVTGEWDAADVRRRNMHARPLLPAIASAMNEIAFRLEREKVGDVRPIHIAGTPFTAIATACIGWWDVGLSWGVAEPWSPVAHLVHRDSEQPVVGLVLRYLVQAPRDTQ